MSGRQTAWSVKARALFDRGHRLSGIMPAILHPARLVGVQKFLFVILRKKQAQ